MVGIGDGDEVLDGTAVDDTVGVGRTDDGDGTVDVVGAGNVDGMVDLDEDVDVDGTVDLDEVEVEVEVEDGHGDEGGVEVEVEVEDGDGDEGGVEVEDGDEDGDEGATAVEGTAVDVGTAMVVLTGGVTTVDEAAGVCAGGSTGEGLIPPAWLTGGFASVVAPLEPRTVDTRDPASTAPMLLSTETMAPAAGPESRGPAIEVAGGRAIGSLARM